MNIIKVLQDELHITTNQVEAVIRLRDEGNTIPFIARYRKEAHGGLTDETLRKLDERLEYLRNLEEKKLTIRRTIEEMGKLTPELDKKIEEAMTQVVLEDLYRPYRPKRRTRASIAREKGLAGLADKILEQSMGGNPQDWASPYLTEIVPSVQEAIDGALDILAEDLSDHAQYRAYIRQRTWDEGLIKAGKKGDGNPVFEMYDQFEEPVRKIPGYRVLALNRGENEKALDVQILAPEEKILGYLQQQLIHTPGSYSAELLRTMAEDAYKRLIAPAIEREIRNALTEEAQEQAIRVFGKNLTQLLMQPPIAGKTVLGWDPAFRTGCKLAVVDATGKVLDTCVIYPTAPQNKVEEARKVLARLIDQYKISLISVGNGTASRESEKIISTFLKETGRPVHYVIVNEAGASVYSASKTATEEFPQYDVGQRSAISIARRIQDPLAELVKIEPRSIGVGQYQHDMNQKRLSEALEGVVEDCVNRVGVDLNTASASLLSYVSGISKTIARNIVSFREENGPFQNRKSLMKVEKLGPRAFEQCAGFLRIRGGNAPLDSTGVHPESYAVAEKLLEAGGYSAKDLLNGGIKDIRKKRLPLEKLAREWNVGLPTLEDICRELEKPSRDPREDMPRPVLHQEVMELEDLKPGMWLTGTVRNVIDFGAFVDIGVHQDGLVHISQMTDRFIRHPLEVVSVGDVVDVGILQVDIPRKRIQLTMKKEKR